MDASDDDARAFIATLASEGQLHHVATGAGSGTVAWRRFGEGPPLVLLHGGHGCWLHWARNIRAWRSGHTVWVPDLPGYGDSAAPQEPTLDGLCKATMHTLDMLVGRETPVTLAGFSSGGLLAARIAARRAAVTGLALIGPAGHGSTRRPRGTLLGWREAFARGDTAALAHAMRHNLSVHMLHGTQAIDALALRIHTEACVRTRFHSRSISLSGDLQGELAGYAGPVLLAWGEEDVTATPQAASASMLRNRPVAQARIVGSAGHWVQYECADRVNRLMLEWLEVIRQRGSA